MLQEDYDAEQLDILAIAFTCVKVLYIGGAIQRARELVILLEPARRAFRTPMHQTVIRNEAAFYGCIQQLLDQAPPQLPRQSQRDQPVMYLCGDSHCLPGRELTLQLVIAAQFYQCPSTYMLYVISVPSLRLRPRLLKDCHWQEEMIHHNSEKSRQDMLRGLRILCRRLAKHGGAWVADTGCASAGDRLQNLAPAPGRQLLPKGCLAHCSRRPTRGLTGEHAAGLLTTHAAGLLTTHALAAKDHYWKP